VRRMNQTIAAKTFAEFFAGIGLVHRGLEFGGWRCVYANDIEQKKHEMYRALYSGASYYHVQDVWKTSEVASKIPPATLLATASFPCTDLSTAGYYKGLKGEESSAFFGFAKVLQRLRDEERQPPLLLIENVPGLLTSKSGEDFRHVSKELAALDYFLDAVIIDAKHFTPQSRPRLFIVGALRDYLPQDSAVLTTPADWLAASAWEDRVSARPDLRPDRLRRAMLECDLPTGWVTYALPRLPKCLIPLTAVVDLDKDQEWWEAESVQKHLKMMSKLHRSVVNELVSRGDRHIGMIYRRRRHGHMRAEVRFDGLAGCLRTPKGGSARQIVIVIDEGQVRMRWMSAVEYARLQGAGDFPIRVPDTQAMFGFADGVCVPVIRWLDESLLSKLAERASVHV